MDEPLEKREALLCAKTSNSQKDEAAVQGSATLCGDLASWMTQLPDQLRRYPVIHLAIPGSHDSGTWPINKHSDWAPDIDGLLRKLKWLGIIVKWITSRWSKAQDYSIRQQLEAGVRYFDLRIATHVSKENTRDFYIVHGLYGPVLTEVLMQFKAFLHDHPKEVVVIDCQHFYDLTAEDHDNLAKMFNDTFGRKIAPATSSYIRNLTMNFMNDNHYQVVMVYRHNIALAYHFYPSNAYPTPWPDTSSPDDLVNVLTENLKSRNSSVGYVSQFILTPVAKTIISNLFTGNLKKFSGLQLLTKKLHWVKAQNPGAGGVNVVIADFVDIAEQRFCRTVIDLNLKLIVESDTELSNIPGLPPVTN